MKKATQESPIVIEDLHKSFGAQRVLNGIDLVVASGETLAVLGRSGTGKSVLLKLIVGLQKPDSGSIRVLGDQVAKLDLDGLNQVRKKIGFLFQSAALYDSLTVEENVAFPLARHTKMSEAQRKNRARELLSAVGMERDVEKLPSEISGGMQKRVGLARALALDPEILLFDEPTAGLDPITAAEIGNLIVEQKEKRNITSVVVTHEIRSARIFADRFVLMNEGKILADGAFDELRKSRNKFVADFLREAA
jgi:phospholipid/cholesterol/gamma-HCH transport system ATP-binding protein